MSRDDQTRRPRATKGEARSKPKAAKPKAPRATRKAKAPKATRKAASKATRKAASKARLPWGEVVSRVIGQPEPAASAPEPAPPTEGRREAETRSAPPTTIRFPAPAPRAPSVEDAFEPDEWVSVTYTGEEVFVHGKAGIFARGTTTHLRGKLARELATKPGFRVRRAA